MSTQCRILQAKAQIRTFETLISNHKKSWNFIEPKLKPSSLTWMNVTPMLSPRSGVVTVVSQGRLWALGGFNGVDRLKSTEVRLTLLMVQWVDMKALENKNHASLVCFFDSLGAIRQISSLEPASSRVVTNQHALSA